MVACLTLLLLVSFGQANPSPTRPISEEFHLFELGEQLVKSFTDASEEAAAKKTLAGVKVTDAAPDDPDKAPSLDATLAEMLKTFEASKPFQELLKSHSLSAKQFVFILTNVSMARELLESAPKPEPNDPKSSIVAKNMSFLLQNSALLQSAIDAMDKLQSTIGSSIP